MSLPIGTRVGPYEVTASLGAGGMGEVFRARDTRLDRDVALKILPAEFSSDPERLARFEREAKTLAALNHPNSAAIHGIEEARHEPGPGGGRALIMELVEGDDLSQRLARGPIPLDEALPIARQIALALEAAHEQGIVHRDLKPANVKVRPDGTVKVLDFGLAKADVGTAAYMAPEQARGQAVDRRADIWAFGCVLFEMVTGRRPFDGPTVTDVLAAVVKSDPDWSALPAETPGTVRRVLRRCLTRDRGERLQHIGDARLELTMIEVETPASPSSASRGSGRSVMLSGWAAAFVATAAGLWAVRSQDVSPMTRPAYEFSLLQPTGAAKRPTISPDGRHLAYEASNRIWLRTLDRADAQPLEGTEDGRSPFWSPDSRRIGFFAGESLKRLSLAGGLPEVLASVPQGWPAATWSAQGSILIEVTETAGDEGWYLLEPGARSVKKLRAFAVDRPINPDKAFPSFLPDGVHFLFTQPVGTTATLQIGSIASETTTPLLQSDSRAIYVSGFVFYVRSGTLLAQPFDADSRSFTGDPVPIVDGIDYFGPTGEASFSVSQEGTLVYRRFPRQSQLQWVNRDGGPAGVILGPNHYGQLSLTRDSQRLAVEITDPRRSTSDLWTVDLDRNVPTRLTSSPRSEMAPRWSPDGSRLAFSTDWNGPPNLYLGDLSGSEPRVLVPFDRTQQYPGSWTPDGTRVVYTKRSDTFARDLWVVDTTSGERRAVLATTFDEWGPAVASNGAWLAHLSNASGRAEAYVRGFPDSTWQTRISSDGARALAWRADARELFYIEPSGAVMAVPISPGPAGSARAGVPVRLFQIDPRLFRSFDVAADGQRFLVNILNPDAVFQTDEVVVDWTRLLRK